MNGFVVTLFWVMYRVWIAVGTKKVCYKSVDLKSVQENILKSVKRITKSDGGIEMTRLIDSVYTR